MQRVGSTAEDFVSRSSSLGGRPTWSRVAAGLFFALAACSGGSGAGAGGCAGGALENGFPEDKRINNAGSARVTRSGLDFLAANGGALAGSLITNAGGADGGAPTKGGPLVFPIPSSERPGVVNDPVFGTKIADYTLKICPGGPQPAANPPDCDVEVDIASTKFQVDALEPNVLRLRGDVPIRLRKLPVHVDTSLTATVDGTVGVGKPIGTGCDPNDGTRATVDYKKFPVEVSLPFAAEKLAPREGYTKIDIEKAVIKVAFDENDISVCATCGVALDTLGICDYFVGEAKKSALDTFGGDKLGELLKGEIRTAFCDKPSPTRSPPCPQGTLVRDGVCSFESNPSVCVSSILGTDGHLDVAAMLATFGATEGGLDYLFAAGGDMTAAPRSAPDDKPYAGHTANGMTLSLFGGAEATLQSKCVPAYTPTLPTGILVPDELQGNTLTPWAAGTPGPDVGLALSSKFIDYALANVYVGGALCLSISTDQITQLKSGLLSLITPSLKVLTFEQRGAAMAIGLRPQSPPHVELGTGVDVNKDPLLRVKLDKLAIDFYLWSADRYLRIFTFTGDFTLPVNLQTAKDPVKNPNGGLLPVLGSMTVANGKIVATPLLAEDPNRIGDALSSLVGGLTSQIAGSITPIDIGGLLASSGITIDIPEGGVRKLTKDDQTFLGVFGNFALAPAAATPPSAHVHLRRLTVNKDQMGLATLHPDTRPTLEVAFDTALAPADARVEFSWAIDFGSRSTWSEERQPAIQVDDLVLQGKHTLRVWSRLRGHPETEDPTPATLSFTIDTLPPYARGVALGEGRVRIEALDYVSDARDLRARVRRIESDAREGDFGSWSTIAELAAFDANGASALDVEVIDEERNVGRTRIAIHQPIAVAAPAPSDNGCSCSAAGAPSPASQPLAFGLLALVAAVALRSRARKRAHRTVLGTALVGLALAPGCSCGSEEEATPACGQDCKQACGPALTPGLVGAYTSITKAKDGTLWVAGYADSSDDGADLYGDLVVGTWDATKNGVAWQTVDGVPKRTDGTCPARDRNGFRGGEDEPGDDVGLWTSIAMASDGSTPIVAYYDATNRAVKLAYESGGTWQSYSLYQKDKVDAGRYAKIAIVDGKPVVVFLAIGPEGKNGMLESRIVVAKAREAVPTSAESWSFQDLVVDDQTPCRPDSCSPGEACIKATKTCTKTAGGCPTACGFGTACLSSNGSSTCVETNADITTETVPAAIGTYLSVAVGPNGLGVVSYDRTHGNLLAFVPKNGTYSMHVIDGETGSRTDGSSKDTGDVGLGASLAIGPGGEWHIACVDRTHDTLLHIVAEGGMNVVARDVVDDGSGLNGNPFPDGKHKVGADAVVRLDDGGAVTVCYQDASVGELRCASGSPGHSYTVKTVSEPGKSGGYFPQLVAGERRVASHWRALDKSGPTYSGDVSIVSY